MAVALRTRPGLPPAVRRASWRLWMVSRIPVYIIAWLAFGLFVMFALGGFVVAAVLGAGFAVGSGVGAILGALGTPLDAGVARGTGVLLVVTLTVFAATAGRQRRRDTFGRKASRPTARIARIYQALADEWRDAADRWPSRRSSTADGPAVRHVSWRTAARSAYAGAPARAVSTEVPVGWRFWKVAPDGADQFSPLLRSVTVDSVWTARRVVAACLVSGSQLESRVHDRTPDLSCSCGIYALKEPLMPMYAAGGVWAAGQVALSGKVLEGRRGYRAEQAEIVGTIRVAAACDHRRTRGPCAGRVVMAATPAGYQAACRGHRHLLEEAFAVIDLMQLQARLELRYGVEVDITTGGPLWI